VSSTVVSGLLRRVHARYRPLMHNEQARVALRAAGLEAAKIEAITGGWAYWTFVVDDGLIARFPRTAAVAAATERELRLLPALARHVSFAVPVPTHRGSWDGMLFFAYRRIEGRALSASDSVPDALEKIAAMLRELHAFPLDEAVRLLDTGPPERAWREQYEQLWPIVQSAALPEMDRGLAVRVEREYDNFFTHLSDVPHCLVHNDLGPEHILINDDSVLRTGIIDFEDAWIGDPAVDFVPLRALLGADALVPLLAERDLGAHLNQRMWFYRWMGSVHAIIYGVTQHVERERVGGLRELRRRMGAPL
jgi:aminoglycoside phosphotransferase (APT) family kinase protein